MAALLWGLSAAALFGGTRAEAQEGVALDQLTGTQLGLGSANGCVGATFQPGRLFESLIPQADADRTANPSLTNGEAVNRALISRRSQLGNSLFAACLGLGQNISSASQSGGSLGALQSTLTVSQFNVSDRRRKRSASRRRSDLFNADLRQYAQGDTVMLDASSEPFDATWSVFGNAFSIRRDSESTDLDAGQEYREYGALVGADRTIGEDALVGVYLRIASADVDSGPISAVIRDPSGDVRPNVQLVDAGDNTNATILSRRNLCGQDLDGGGSNDQAGLGGYFSYAPGSALVIDGSVEYTIERRTAHRSVCYIDGNFLTGANVLQVTVGRDVLSGVIEGDADVSRIAATIGASTVLNLGAAIITPRVALRYGREDIDGYAETGRAVVSMSMVDGNGSFIPVPGTGDLDGLNGIDGAEIPELTGVLIAKGAATGLELAYEDREIESIQAELGLDLRIPIALSNNWTLTPMAGASYVHEFEDDLRRIDFHFAQDLRSNPKNLFFNSSAPDDSFYAATLGVSLESPDGFGLFAQAQGVFDNERYDEQAYIVGVRRAF